MTYVKQDELIGILALETEKARKERDAALAEKAKLIELAGRFSELDYNIRNMGTSPTAEFLNAREDLRNYLNAEAGKSKAS